MKSSQIDYLKLYQLQNKFLTLANTINIPFYLTGGTALGRFYLDHRFCENLYYNIDNGNSYLYYISELMNKIRGNFTVKYNESIFNEDFTRIAVVEDDVILNIDLMRNTKNHEGNLASYKFGLIDSPIFILPKKLSAVPWRNEPKDVFDIVSIAKNYSFNWAEIFIKVKQNSLVKIHEIETHLSNFQVELITQAGWLKTPLDKIIFKKELKIVAHEFSTCIENSLGINKTPLAQAKLL